LADGDARGRGAWHGSPKRPQAIPGTYVKVPWGSIQARVDEDVWFAALRVLLPPYEGGAMVLYRGQCDGEPIGASWTRSRHIARKFAL